MTGAHLLRTVAAALDAAEIPFMLTGSVAAAWQGADRATMDVDVAELVRVAGQLDDAYLERWIAELGLLDQWRAARRAAETP